MNSESNSDGKIMEIICSIPSTLSNNKMLFAVIAFLYMIPLATTASFSPVRALLFDITLIMIFGLLAMSFDLQLGRAGLLNFGHVAFFGVGAYVMAFALEGTGIPFVLIVILSMLVGAFLGFIMGLTTSRMKGTAFAFIALAIAMFLYNFFAENPDISGGETGLTIATPDIIRSAPFYLFFVAIAFVMIAAFLGMVILYLKNRREPIGLILFTPAMLSVVGVLLIFGTNIFGPILVFVAFLGMVALYAMERKRAIDDPLQISEEEHSFSEEEQAPNVLTTYALPVSIVIIAIIGIVLAFGSNIGEMTSLWFENNDIFYYTIPVQYYFALTCVLLTYLFIRRLVASPFGRMVAAVAQNEERAEALGYNSYVTKIMVVTISGAIAALAGALYTPLIRIIDPETALGVGISIDAMLYTIIGGLGTLLGPLLGAGVVVYSENNLVSFITDYGLPGELWLVGLGLLYIGIVLFMPLGIIGTIRSKSYRIKEKLLRLKIGRFEFGIKESDYWVFAMLGIIGLILSLLMLSL